MDEMNGHVGMDNTIIGNMSVDGGEHSNMNMNSNNMDGSGHASAFYFSVDIPVYLFKNWKIDTTTDFILALVIALILSFSFEISKRLHRNGQLRLRIYNHKLLKLRHLEKKIKQLLDPCEVDPTNCHQAKQSHIRMSCDNDDQSTSGSAPIPSKESTLLEETIFRNLSFDLGDNRWSFDGSDISDIQYRHTVYKIYRNKIIVHFLLSLLNCIKLVIGYFLMLIVMTFNGWVFVCVVTSAAVGYFLFEKRQYDAGMPQVRRTAHVLNAAEMNVCHNAEAVPLHALKKSISTDV
ncbi:high affinity copper uptake protein 1-like [Anneissia japonica]|uniref:high affinity copper uptake protein 1-like n=1 Tax=Anneissia japonica TaxID=1529436 RepID=UPI0014254D98|nr:high affinity copper uptake protein 1-like [Anneissia japonica]XP_033098674.1 high affinity copper uptake protein 1-like [Anneissia japonica]XP_033098675.1 high affinity copper uptake protein 1-like [Anneissia japonica]XP_033098676.1 high affinity copper uptake protein 1-like [Anneissia japonica]XP_033098677.1 high affinity copper uptake protein 1-like [Anneissia japonica]XP_033098678.1 high affinity copper uptake protein 1-like [Anneissia japonica]XP_033098679.1 high affinity copper uptak